MIRGEATDRRTRAISSAHARLLQNGGIVARLLLMDEFHVTARAPRGLSDTEYDAIRQTLDDEQFQSGLRRAVRAVFRQYPQLSKVRVRVTR